MPGLCQWKSAVRLVKALSGKKTALTGIMDARICDVEHTAIVRWYFSLIPINLQVRLKHFDVFLLLRTFGAFLWLAVTVVLPAGGTFLAVNFRLHN